MRLGGVGSAASVGVDHPHEEPLHDLELVVGELVHHLAAQPPQRAEELLGDRAGGVAEVQVDPAAVHRVAVAPGVALALEPVHDRGGRAGGQAQGGLQLARCQRRGRRLGVHDVDEGGEVGVVQALAAGERRGDAVAADLQPAQQGTDPGLQLLVPSAALAHQLPARPLPGCLQYAAMPRQLDDRDTMGNEGAGMRSPWITLGRLRTDTERPAPLAKLRDRS